MDFEDVYKIGRFIAGIIVFIGIWIYAFTAWGFLIGLAIGWLPALVGGIILGIIWPLAVLVLLVLAAIIFFPLWKPIAPFFFFMIVISTGTAINEFFRKKG